MDQFSIITVDRFWLDKYKRFQEAAFAFGHADGESHRLLFRNPRWRWPVSKAPFAVLQAAYQYPTRPCRFHDL